MKVPVRLPGGRISQRWLPWLAGLACLVVAGAFWFSAGQTKNSLAAPLFQQPQPTYNWYVCEDLGIGGVPGIPGSYQRLRLCHNRGWQVLVYCIEPLKPAPPLNTSCSRLNADTYWCGDLYQLLRPYQIAETPTPGPFESPTPSATQTFTSSPTATVTRTASPTSSATATASPSSTATPSPLPSETPTQTSTPTGTMITPPASTLPPAETTITPLPSITLTVPVNVTPRFSPTPRPHPGGPGNVSTALPYFLWFGLLVLAPGAGLIIGLAWHKLSRK